MAGLRCQCATRARERENATDSSGTANPNLDYTTVRDSMAARAGRPADSILAYLPTASQITASVPGFRGASFDNTTLGVTHANQKALGLVADPLNDTTVDGNISF